jgi:adenylate kinase family enzyme
MKHRLNITVTKDLIKKMKGYADHQETSISQIVEKHFEELLKRPSKFPKEMSLVEFVKTLPKSKVDIPTDFDFKKEYYKIKSKEYDEQHLF